MTFPILGEKLTLVGDDQMPVDLGFVGNPTTVDAAYLGDFLDAGLVPVIPSLCLRDGGGWLNVNADTIASAVAGAFHADAAIFLTDTPGILRDRHDPSSLITSLNAAQVQDLIRTKVIDEGMIPKVEACLDSLRSGVRKTHIIDGRLKHSLLLEIYTDRGVGTEIVLGQ